MVYMNRLQPASDSVRSGAKLLCPFLTAGFPSLEATPDLLLAAQAGGAGIIELGIPFSDPVADGPVIQASFTQALAHGATVRASLAAVAAARKRGLSVPVLAMVSFSIIFKRGTQDFALLCAQQGLDGVILPDIPLEEAPAIVDVMRDAGLRTSLLVAPTTAPGRRQAIARLCNAFVYYLSVSGITGERKSLPTDIGPNVAALREACQVPICVGFGISTAAQVREVTRGAGADGAIVGSAVIRRLTECAGRPVAEQGEAVRGFVADLAMGLSA
jgi:tryptophan synthase alpha chain